MAVADAIGSLAECTMSLYVLRRLAGAREVASIRLLEAADAFRRSFDDHTSRVYAGLELLRALPLARGELGPVLEGLAVSASNMAESVASVLRRERRFGALQRLELERGLSSVGEDVDQLYGRFELIQAVLAPREAVLCCQELLAGTWSARPSFVGIPVSIALAGDREARLVGDPRVLSRLLGEVTIDALSQGGVAEPTQLRSRSSHPYSATHSDPPGEAIVWSISLHGEALSIGVRCCAPEVPSPRTRLALRPSSPSERAVVRAVARYSAGASFEDGACCVSVATAIESVRGAVDPRRDLSL